MAIYLGGDITEIVCNHPTLGDFRFQTKANESYTVDFGGIRNNDDANGLTGSGGFIQQKNRVAWSFEGVVMADLISGNEIKNLPKISESAEECTWTFSHISGAVWRGKGVPVGDLQLDTNTAQISVKVAGGGKLEVIS
jgi:hypothetical protein